MLLGVDANLTIFYFNQLKWKPLRKMKSNLNGLQITSFHPFRYSSSVLSTSDGTISKSIPYSQDVDSKFSAGAAAASIESFGKISAGLPTYHSTLLEFYWYQNLSKSTLSPIIWWISLWNKHEWQNNHPYIHIALQWAKMKQIRAKYYAFTASQLMYPEKLPIVSTLLLVSHIVPVLIHHDRYRYQYTMLLQIREMDILLGGS